ncbi:MAG: hypothetical protein IPP48_15575 [Chitinophagaceae bacterium]|nr:hypothetical protein [Chitinophagaceae bacterium]
MIEIVRHLYENGAMGLCIHLSAFALKNQYEPSFYKYMLSMCFSKIYYNDKNLKRFNSVNTYADKGTNLKELQDYLFSVSTKDLEVLALYFLNTTAETNSEDYEFANTMYQTQVKEKETVIAYTAFNTKFPNSKYSYLIQPKKEK